jgi:hypothetical protein
MIRKRRIGLGQVGNVFAKQINSMTKPIKVGTGPA